MGDGATSVVVKACRNKDINDSCAIKKVKRVFEHTAFAHRAMRELRLLRCLGSHENIIKVHDVILPSDLTTFGELYVVTDYMDTDLHDVIRLNSKISRQHKQYFMYQLLRGLKYCHSAGVIHRDIKPQNLLVNDKYELKICDFGLATVKNEKINATYDLTPYVVTRWFRAPELLLKYQSKNYSSKIDMWSAGCVFAELYLRKVLFGEKDLAKQVQRFVALLGLPPQHIMDQIKDVSVRNFLQECASKTKRVTFDALFPGIEKDALDLLRRLLCYDPAERLSAEQALEHPFFKELH